jgi:hypothetical protein
VTASGAATTAAATASDGPASGTATFAIASTLSDLRVRAMRLARHPRSAVQGMTRSSPRALPRHREWGDDLEEVVEEVGMGDAEEPLGGGRSVVPTQHVVVGVAHNFDTPTQCASPGAKRRGATAWPPSALRTEV